MTNNREQFINGLTADLQAVKSVNTRLSALLWLLGSLVFAAALAFLTGPYRSGIGNELMSSMQFLLESVVGIVAVGLLINTAYGLAVPSSGALYRRLLLPLMALLIWIGFYVFGLQQPAIEPSMAGKRAFCYAETFMYAVPLMIVGLVWVRRQWALYPVSTGLLIGLAAGAIPTESPGIM